MDKNVEGDDDAALPALLWDTMPDDAESHPDYMAIQSLMYDESTPREQAENFKEQGNQRVKVALQSKNKLYLEEAIKYYTQGIEVELADHSELKSILYSNRAQAEIHLRNWRKALNDSRAAVKWHPANLKAYYRGARAALRLDEVGAALQLCEEGLKLEPTNKELQQTHTDARKRNTVLEEHQKQSTEERRSLEKEARSLLQHFARRNIRLCQSNFKVGKLKPFVDDENLLHWPVLFVYPESMQQDIIQDVSETDKVSELLDVMFSANAEPLAWDTKKEYRRNSVDVYYLANAGAAFSQDEMMNVLMGEYHGDPDAHAPKMYGDKAAYFVKIDPVWRIQEVLSEADCIVPGVPTFFIVARGSNYHDRFLESVGSKQ